MKDIIIALIGIVGGGALGSIITTILNDRSRRTQARYQHQSTSFAEAVQLLDMQKGQIDRQDKRIAHLEKEHAGCLEKSAIQERTIGMLEATVNRIEGVELMALIVVNDQGIIQEWNDGAKQIFKYGREEALGKYVTMITPPRFRGQHILAFTKVVEEKRFPNLAEPLKIFGLTRYGEEVPITIERLAGWEIEGKYFYSAEITRR